LKFAKKPDPEIRSLIKNFGLKWNALRHEWYGYLLEIDIQNLKSSLNPLEFQFEFVKNKS
jgi:hypothetical protein